MHHSTRTHLDLVVRVFSWRLRLGLRQVATHKGNFLSSYFWSFVNKTSNCYNDDYFPVGSLLKPPWEEAQENTLVVISTYMWRDIRSKKQKKDIFMNLWKRIKSMDAYSTVCPVTVSNQIQELKPSWTVNFSLTTWLGIKHSWHNICSLWFSKQLKCWIIGLAVADTAKISLLGLLLPMNGTPFCFPKYKGEKSC